MRRVPAPVAVALLATIAVVALGAPAGWTGASVAAAAVAVWFAVSRAPGRDAAGATPRAAGAAMGGAVFLFGLLVVVARALPLPLALAAIHARWLEPLTLVAGSAALLVLVGASAWVGSRALVAVAPRFGRRGLAIAALAAFGASAALACVSAFGQGGDDVDQGAWLADLDRAATLHSPLESDEIRAGLANARYQGTEGGDLVQRFRDVRVVEGCDSGPSPTRCAADIYPRGPREPRAHKRLRRRPHQHDGALDSPPEVRADESDAAPHVRVLTALMSRLLPHPGSDVAVPEVATQSPTVELRTDGDGAWFVLRDGVLIDAATADEHLTLADVRARFSIPGVAIGVAALGLVAALAWLVRGVRCATWSDAIAAGVAGTLSAEGWLDIPGRDAVRVPKPSASSAGPVVVFHTSARSSSYRRAPTGRVELVPGDQAELVAYGDDHARRFLVGSIALVVVTAAPLAAALLSLG